MDGWFFFTNNVELIIRVSGVVIVLLTVAQIVIEARKAAEEKAREAAVAAEIAALREELRRHKFVDMDGAIDVCRRLGRIEARHGQVPALSVLVKDGDGDPARLILSANPH